MKPFPVQLPPLTSYLVPLRPKHLPQYPGLENPSLSFSLNLREKASHPYKTTGKIIILNILMLIFLESKREDKLLWAER
jgi:hypothetical protein